MSGTRPAATSAEVKRAVALMAASTVFFGCMAACIRLASAQLHPFEIAFFRNFFGFVFVLLVSAHLTLVAVHTVMQSGPDDDVQRARSAVRYLTVGASLIAIVGLVVAITGS